MNFTGETTRKTRTGRGTRFSARFEWSVLLATAFVLMALSPSFSATVSHVVAPAWHVSAFNATAFGASAFGASAMPSVSALPSLPALWNCAVWSSQSPWNSATAGTQSPVAKLAPPDFLPSLETTRGFQSIEFTKSTPSQVGTFDGVYADTTSPFATVPHAAMPARYDLSRRFRFHSLTPHQASFLAGARTNAYLE